MAAQAQAMMMWTRGGLLVLWNSGLGGSWRVPRGPLPLRCRERWMLEKRVLALDFWDRTRQAKGRLTCSSEWFCLACAQGGRAWCRLLQYNT